MSVKAHEVKAYVRPPYEEIKTAGMELLDWIKQHPNEAAAVFAVVEVATIMLQQHEAMMDRGSHTEH